MKKWLSNGRWIDVLLVSTGILMLAYMLWPRHLKTGADVKIKNARGFFDVPYQYVIIDSCEYLVIGEGSARSITHSGRCKKHNL